MTNVGRGQLREAREAAVRASKRDTLAEQLVFSKLPDSWKVGRIQTGADMTRLAD